MVTAEATIMWMMLLLVEGDLWNEIELRTALACEILRLWSFQHKMTFSPEKTMMMFLKGRLTNSHQERVSMAGLPIKYVSAQKYLVVILDENL